MLSRCGRCRNIIASVHYDNDPKVLPELKVIDSRNPRGDETMRRGRIIIEQYSSSFSQLINNRTRTKPTIIDLHLNLPVGY